MKYLITIIIICLSTITNAQINVTGRITTKDKEPLPFVSISIKGTTKGTTTNDNGEFSINYKKNDATIIVSFVGFQTHTQNITQKTKHLSIILKEENNELDEITIVTRPKKRLKKKENPAYKILKEVWKHKKKKGTDTADFYQYQKHEITEIGLKNIDTGIVKTIFKKNFKKFRNKFSDDKSDNKLYIPVFMNETIHKIYGNNLIHEYRDDTEAEKSKGIVEQGFILNRLATTFNTIDISKNNITLLNKSFASPISSTGFATYDYLLQDSTVVENKKLYRIFFFPRRKGDLAFEGDMYIADKSFSVQKITMRVGNDVNFNFIKELEFSKEFSLNKDSIFLPKKDVYRGEFSLNSKNEHSKSFVITKTNIFSDYNFNNSKPKGFYQQQIVKYKPNQFLKKEEYWQQHIAEENQTTYQIINDVKNNREIRNLNNIINTFSSGFVRISPHLQIGSLWNSIRYNQIEGTRIGLGIRNFKNVNDRIRVYAQIGYGLKDKKLKYGAEARYLATYKPRISLGILHTNDLEQLSSNNIKTYEQLDTKKNTSALFARGENYYLTKIENTTFNIDFNPIKNFNIGSNLIYKKIQSANKEKFNIDYLDPNNNLKSNMTDFSSEMYIGYTPNRRIYGYGVAQRFGKNIFATYILKWKKGWKTLGGDFDYNKLEFLYTQPIMLAQLGILRTTIETGKTFGSVPLSLLSPVPVNQTYGLMPNTFSLQNYYDFVTDQYVNFHLEHHFNGFILNKIPLINSLKLRSLLTFRGAYGKISNANQKINKSSIRYNAPDELYYEYGFGIENIGYRNFRLFRVDAIWRSNYKRVNTNSPKPPKFTLRFSIKPDF